MTDDATDPVPRALVRAALAAYDLPPVTGVNLIRQLNNAVYEVATSGGHRFVLRVHRTGYRDVAHTRSELRFVELVRDQLRGTPVSVPRPVPARDGSLAVEVTVTVDGTEVRRHCDLLTWLPGHGLRPGRGLGPGAARLLGQALALLHRAAATGRPGAAFQFPTWDRSTLFAAGSPFRPGPLDEIFQDRDRALFDEVAERATAVFDRLGRDADAFGVIHSDFILGNCRFLRRRSGWHVGVIDFDDCGWGYFLFDMGAVLGNLSDFPSYPTLRRAFLAGYRAVRPLPGD